MKWFLSSRSSRAHFFSAPDNGWGSADPDPDLSFFFIFWPFSYSWVWIMSFFRWEFWPFKRWCWLLRCFIVFHRRRKILRVNSWILDGGTITVGENGKLFVEAGKEFKILLSYLNNMVKHTRLDLFHLFAIFLLNYFVYLAERLPQFWVEVVFHTVIASM